MIDKEEIIRALTTWFQPGDVFEIRALNALSAEMMRPHTASGYFEYEHIAEAAEAIGKLRGYTGVYVIINPVTPDLLARSYNRLKRSDTATADNDIVSRRWLLIDCDAVRKSGISSTDEEHQLALEKAKEIRSFLSEDGWPEPVMLDSGNGAQMTYRINLPADDEGLVKSVLEKIALASSEQVKVDLTVFNPARLWRLPGTMNCKGDSIPTRPHRMAKILNLPETLSEVSVEQLKAVAGDVVSQPVVYENNPQQGYHESAGFSIDEWISKFAPDAGPPQIWNSAGGRKWIFKVCPFNSAHTNSSAGIFEHPDGALAFRCHHDSCTGNDWRKFRIMREPGCYDRKEPIYTDVDISGILNQQTEREVVEEEIIPVWRKVTNDDIRKCLEGTLLGEITDIYASVSRPPLPLEGALLKSIITVSCCLSGEASEAELTARYGGNLGTLNLIGCDRARLKIDTAGGQLCNAYAMLVAESACGKDIGGIIGKFAHMTNPDLYHCAQDYNKDWNVGTSGSPEGIAKILCNKPNGLLSISELSKWLNKECWQSKATEFLTEAFSGGFFDQNFSDRGRGAASRTALYCAPNIIGNIQPNAFQEWVEMIDVDTGFLGRFLIAKMPEYYGNPKNFDSIALMKRLETAVQPFLRKRGIVTFEDGYSEKLQAEFIGKCDKRFVPSWRRLCNEYYPRFAVMLSVTNDLKTQHDNVIITPEVLKKAETFVYWFFKNAEEVLSSILQGSGNARNVEKQLRRIFNIIRNKDTGKGVSLSTISRNASGLGTTSKERKELIAELIERQWIKCNDKGGYQVYNPPPDLVR